MKKLLMRHKELLKQKQISLKYLTQAEYDVLSEEEKKNENVIYYITDLEDRTHDHYNKEVLDLIDDEFIKNISK